MCLMCDCESCDCCPDRTWCIFFGIWNTAIGSISLIWTSLALDDELDKPVLKGDDGRSDIVVLVDIFYLIFTVLHLLSGIFILLGVFMQSRNLFRLGKSMSHVLPWAAVYTIILPVMHLVCLFRVCRYYNGM